MDSSIAVIIRRKSLIYSLAIICVLSMILSACGGAATAIPTQAQVMPPEGKYIIGYYPAWVAERSVFVKNIPADKLTHINYAFSNVSDDGKCILGDPAADVERIFSAAESVSGSDDSKSADFHGNFNQLLQLKQRFPHLKVLISVGGWSWSGNFSAAAQDDEARQRFAASCIELYLNQYRTYAKVI